MRSARGIWARDRRATERTAHPKLFSGRSGFSPDRFQQFGRAKVDFFVGAQTRCALFRQRAGIGRSKPAPLLSAICELRTPTCDLRAASRRPAPICVALPQCNFDFGAVPSDPNDEDILEIIDQRRPPPSPVKYVALSIVAIVFIVAAYLFIRHFTPREIMNAATTPLEKGAALTERFLKHVGDVLTSSHHTTTSEIEIGRVTATDKLGPLIVAKQDLVVKFTHVDEAIFGTSTAEVKAVGQAFYYVPLLGPQARWKIETMERDGVRVCVVHAPALRVLTPVNVDTRSLQIRTETGTLRTNREEMTNLALGDITPRLNREALNHETAVRGAARKTIAAFVKTWLKSDANWGPGQINAIQVLFPGETAVDTDFAIPGFYER